MNLARSRRHPHALGQKWRYNGGMGKFLIVFMLAAACAFPALAAERVKIRLGLVPLRSIGGVVNEAEIALFDRFFDAHPEYEAELPSQLDLPEGLNEAQQMMAFAGEQGPDVFDVSIRMIQNYIRQGLVYPLDELITQQMQTDSGWTLPTAGFSEDHWSAARDNDGRLYALVSDAWVMALWYRRDLFVEAGIVPPRPPETWDEFYDFAQRLTYPHREIRGAVYQYGQFGTAIGTSYWAGYLFTNFVYQAGGDMTVQERVCPVDGVVSEFIMEERAPACTACGRSLEDQPPKWKLAYGREPGQLALRFYKKLRWSEWARCSRCGTCSDLPVAHCPRCEELNPVHSDSVRELKCRVCQRKLSVQPSRFSCPACRKPLRDEEVFTGVVRLTPGFPGQDEMLSRGEIAMSFSQMKPDAVENALNIGGLRPDQIAFGPPPRAPGSTGVQKALMGGKAWCINALAARDPKKLQACWDYIMFRCSDEAQRIKARVYVRGGFPQLVRPEHLERFGFQDEYDDYDPLLRDALEQSWSYGRIQPHDLNYQHVEAVALAVPVDKLMYQGGQNRDPKALIVDSMNRANARHYKLVAESVAQKRRTWAAIIFAFVAPVVIGLLVWGIREHGTRHAGVLSTRATQVVGSRAKSRRNTIIAWSVMAPALITVLLWQYVPLVRGTVMAFFDYKIYGGGAFIGLQNFIEVLVSPDFWNSVRATIIYVGLSLLIGFVAPIALALLLHEIPRGKMLFRVIFYLPAVTTGIVIMFLWKMFYAPTPTGLLNRIAMPILHFFNVVPADVQAIDWLHNPWTAMLCIVIPGVWAGAGPGSLIYLAALKMVPEDLYESVALDGGTIAHKIRHVMYPALRPLILINFIGAFIGSFHAMQNVFVMTGGGPANATMVIGVHIWSNAFLYLRFGYATAMAWVLGSILIGFTVLQLRLLKRVEFRAAARVDGA